MKSVFRKARNKFLLVNLMITMLVLLTSFFAVYLTTYTNVQKENQQKLEEAAAMQAAALEKKAIQSIENGYVDVDTVSERGIYVDVDEGADALHIRHESSTHSVSFSVIIDESGEIYSVGTDEEYPDSYYQGMTQAIVQAPHGRVELAGRQWQYETLPSTPEMMRLVSEKNLEDGRLVAFLDVTDTEKMLRDLLITFSVIGVISFIVVFFISLYSANRSIQPISSMWEAQRRFVADASHELKTPLSVIAANHDVVMANEEETVKSQKEWLSYIRMGADRMAKLVNSLLLLAKTEDTSTIVEKQPFIVSDTANRIADAMESTALGKDISFKKQIEPKLELSSNEEMVSQILGILLENAMKYVDEQGEVVFSVKKNARQVVIRVENSGEGIAKEHLPKIFDRFYRTDEARTSESGGFGLGLSIAQSLVEKLDGTIYAESVVGKVTRFIVVLNEN